MTTDAIRNWGDLTGEQFNALDRKQTIAVVSCSPLEVHGPHLPVITDSCEAEALTLRTLEFLCERQPRLRFLRLPPLYVANDVVPQPGSVTFRISTLIDTLLDLGRSLSLQGFHRIWVSNFHGGPRHIVAIEHACNAVSRQYGTEMHSLFSLLSRRLTTRHGDLSEVLTSAVPGITEAFLREDSHAGFIETSLMLHLRQELVNQRYTSLSWRGLGDEELPRPATSGWRRVVDAARYFAAVQNYYLNDTYSGSPQHATAEFGEKILDLLASRSAEILEDLLAGKLSREACQSPLWPMRHLLLSDRFDRLFKRFTRFKNPVF